MIWDGHPAHTSRLLADLPVLRVRLPPYSPESTRRARVPEWRRTDKQTAADPYLQEVAADYTRIRQLCGWDWVTAAFGLLPTP